MKPKDNSSNMPNKNTGTTGVNKQHQQVLDNRSKQITHNKQQRG
ncbi:hypothetical protein N9W11_01280 [Psychrosphaera haliotis]|nr:hypothetical protein [Psychrosphaera haliotis]